MAAGDLSTFANIRTNREQARCSICSRIVGAFQPTYRWVSIVRIRLIRLSPSRIMSICIDQTESIAGDIEPHLHHCILASVDRNINSEESPIEFVNVRNGHVLNPECLYSHHFEQSTINYPLDVERKNASTQTDREQICQHAESQTNDNEVNKVEPSPSIESTTNTRVLTNTENVANNAFWDSLEAEPSTSNGSYNQDSFLRAINAMEKETTEALIKELAEYLVEIPEIEGISNEPITFDDIPNDVSFLFYLVSYM